jgi:RimJ/RimL family protein N-acetyltransferase
MARSGGRVVFPIETDRLRIEPFRADDEKRAHRLFRHRKLWKYNDASRPRTKRGSRNRLALYISTQEQHGLSAWAVREKASGRLIGDCGLIPADWRGPEIELVFRMTPRRWGEGFATEAARAVLEAGLTDAGLETIQARIHAENAATIHIVERLGMTHRRTVVLDGTPWEIYAIGS